jgi:hypothetical protein
LIGVVDRSSTGSDSALVIFDLQLTLIRDGRSSDGSNFWPRRYSFGVSLKCCYPGENQCSLLVLIFSLKSFPKHFAAQALIIENILIEIRLSASLKASFYLIIPTRMRHFEVDLSETSYSQKRINQILS